MLRVAVIGLGDVSNVHLSAIQASGQAELVAVCDHDESLRGTVPGVSFYTDYHVMLEREALDCVHICLPHHLHYHATRACVEKGIHVMQEKPLALNVEEGLELVKLEEAYPHVKICVCLQNRYNESFERLLEIVRSGRYGRLLGIKGLVAWYRPKDYYEQKPWRGQLKYAGGGVMINQALHTLDIMQLLGGEIHSIRGNVDQLLDYGIEVEDTATARMTFSDGAAGLFFATVANTENSSVELQVTLEQKRLVIRDSMLFVCHENGEQEILAEDRKLPGTKFYYGASHAKLIHRFYACIDRHSHDYVHARDALPSLQIIDMIHKSAELQQEIRLGGEYAWSRGNLAYR
ncbi:Gfo/Idh/MocA family protein [Ectobacillus ponti]|uniref:Gfo/Idh/MocA family oxidoreductase n=1 Tax=Ectobacillus ponti TaxID=2961894 RepID=A0AA41X7V2_9BACI|nr:Gfo/Idh/MocA family oxidoreductase [Ectobacillus ponti]MCP8970514.1 Gfo/Idh/MocA family oxidoreductase [Ectobacillus ponti]